jgi:serine/threonine protein kinase
VRAGRIAQKLDVEVLRVPHAERVKTEEDVQRYLAEARIVASLDHPGIVPVHDVGRTEGGLCFVVSKLIEGSDLREKIRESHLAFNKSAELVATVAEALHHAHVHGVVHRDIKPNNILVDGQGKPYVTDSGLALREEEGRTTPANRWTMNTSTGPSKN